MAGLQAIVVLGCRVRLDAKARLSPGALARRVEMGARTYQVAVRSLASLEPADPQVRVRSLASLEPADPQVRVRSLASLEPADPQVRVRSLASLEPADPHRRDVDADERTVIVVSGGRRWGHDVEADVMARELALQGVPERAIVRERCSLSTRENARFTADLLTRRGVARTALVTCPWHMARAVACFARAGVAVEPVAASSVVVPWPSRAWRWGLERVLTFA